jgi:hypothetical protein
MIDDENFIGADREAGDRFCQLVLHAGEVGQLRRFLVLA